MKQFFLKRLALSAVALFIAVFANAATETYDFTGFSNNTVLKSETSTLTINGQTLYMMETSDNTFNSRFAVGPSNRTGSSEFIFKNYNTEKGFKIGYSGRYFSILNLAEGDAITITMREGSTNLNFSGTPIVSGKSAGDALESATSYTISADGNLNLVTAANNTYIEQIVITPAVVSETIHLGKKTEYYDFEAFGKKSIDKDENNKEILDPLSVGGNTFNNRFSTQQANCFAANGSGWGFQVNYNKWFSINNLKAGDQVKIHFTNQNAQVLNFDDPTLVGKSSDDKLVEADTWYTLSSATDKLKLVNTVNINNYKTNYLNITIITTDETITEGTLVSTKALDFSKVSGVTAYVATNANKGSVTFSEVSKVPANTPLFLRADNAGKYEIPALDGVSETIVTNLLKGSATATTPLTSDEDTKYYVFGVLNGEAGFYPVGTLTSAAGKAYLELTAEQAAAASRLALKFEDDSKTTGIAEIENGKKFIKEGVYDLQGRKVGSQLTKDLYIVNGKKVFIK